MILLEFLHIRGIEKIDGKRNGGQITAVIKLGLCRLPHFGIALAFTLGCVTTIAFLRIGDLQVIPLNIGIVINMRTVNEGFRKIKDLTVLVFARGHNAGHDIRFVNIVADRSQIFPLTKGDIRSRHGSQDIHPTSHGPIRRHIYR